MKYQLVFQFNTAAIATIEAFDQFVALEEELISALDGRKDAIVDGHDFGMDEFNIFIHTNDPESLFIVVGDFISASHPEQAFSAGYRDFEDDDYTPLWPSSSTSFKVS
jgi:hypothetical protein